MVFSSPVFLFYFLPVLIMLYFIAPKRAKNYVLILFSLAFYAWGEPIFVGIMLVSALIDYTVGRLIDYDIREHNKKYAKYFLLISVFANLGILTVFKYADFIIGSFNTVFNTSFPLTNLPLPIGISFYTFQTLSYSIDVYRGEVKAQKNFANLLLYTTLFPQLVAGPIVRYSTIEKQIQNRSITFDKFSDGVVRFISGLSKKVLIANQMAIIADGIFAVNPSDAAILTSYLGIIAYTLQIYFDFSGYSDMAIGLGKMFGFDFLENFNYPYISCSVTEFWRRWHISLGTWFKDYLYFPLGGSRVPRGRHILNLLIVWSLTGLWHGASWNYLVWGLFMFVFIVLEKYVIKVPKKYSPIRNIITMLLIMVGWVIFRSDTLAQAALYVKNMLCLGNKALTDYDTIYYFTDKYREIIAAVICALPVLPLIKKVYSKIKNKPVRIALGLCQTVFLTAMLALCTVSLINQTYNPFIYFKF